VFTALAHPARRQILLTIHFRGGTMTAGEIAGRFAHTWATTTGHIRILESALLINQQKIGRVRHYTINEERLSVVEEWLGWFKKKSAENSTIPNAESFFLIDYSRKKIPKVKA
jgi:DNA-binding transcriptional ArsR family regulator